MGVMRCVVVVSRGLVHSLLISTALLYNHHFSHLLDRHCTFHIHPFVLDDMFLLEFEH